MAIGQPGLLSTSATLLPCDQQSPFCICISPKFSIGQQGNVSKAVPGLLVVENLGNFLYPSLENRHYMWRMHMIIMSLSNCTQSSRDRTETSQHVEWNPRGESDEGQITTLIS